MNDKTTDSLTFLVLGHSPEGATGWPHPARIAIHPRGSATLLNMSMGPHIANVGGQVSIGRVIVDGELAEAFAEEFDACECHWLVPFLARLANDENVTMHELAEAYKSRFSHYPNTEQGLDRTF